MTDRLPATSGINPSASYYREEKLDLDAWFKITQIDYERLLGHYSWGALFDGVGDAPFRVLDLGCGTARFPYLLDQQLPDGVHVEADLLDISEYCLDAALAQYRALRHFSPGMTYRCAVEDLPQAVDRNRRCDLIWAIHSLCTVDREKMAAVYRACLEVLKPNGRLLIYQLARDSSYYRLYDYYLAHHPAPHSMTNMLTAEDHQQVLISLGVDFAIHKIRFTHRIDCAQRHLLAVYLKKCIMDNDPEVLEFFLPVLNDHLDPDHAQYRFDQEVDLLVIDKGRNSGAPVA